MFSDTRKSSGGLNT